MKAKVLFILPDLAAGGAQPMNVRLARHLKAQGWDVGLTILFERAEVITPEMLDGLEVHRLHARSLFSKLLALLRLARLIRRYEVVVGGMEFAATNYGYLASWLARRPFISWTHIAFEPHQWNAGAFDRLISKWIYRRCPYVVFPSRGALDSLRRLLRGRPKQAHWEVIENFIDQTEVLNKEEVTEATIFDKPIVLGVGRFVSQKAFDRLIRAHALLRARGLDHHLVLLGDGPLRSELEEQSQMLGVSKSVFMPGYVTNVRRWLSRATVFALCSRYEGFSLVLLEALSCGLPAVAMDCASGPREILDDGRCGLLVPDGDEEAFAEAIGRLLRNPDLRVHYAAVGRERANHYRAERIVPQWEALFERILQRKRL